MESWKDIRGYEGRYQVSDHGRIRSLTLRGNHGGKVLRPCPTKDGYYRVNLYDMYKKLKHVSIHRLVAQHFLPEIDHKRLQVNHKDNNRCNNHLSNLEWVTCKENVRHSIIFGNKLYQGEGHNSKLTKKDIVEIFRLRSIDKQWTYKRLGEWFSVRDTAIAKICNRERWWYVEIPKEYLCPR